MTVRILPILLTLALALPARAQTVAGEFVDTAGAPIPSARVLLQDESGRTVHSALTGRGGRFILRAPAAGVFVLKGERIGFAATTSAPLRLAAGEQVAHRMVAAGSRVMLEAVVVEGQPRCTLRSGASAETAAVWDEVRKALDLVSATSGDRRARYTAELFERELAVPSGSVTADTRRRVEGMAEKPFVTVPPERLASVGFIEKEGEAYLYAAPDADVLLSDGFLENHCFRLRTAGAPAPGLIGLAFEPVAGRRVSDVQGVLWLNRATSELDRLEYEYTRAPLRGPRGVPGGRMKFQRLADGRWLTSDWVIRMPVEGDGVETHALAAPPRRVVAVREVGGSLRAADAPAPVPAPPTAVAAAPVQGATITVEAAPAAQPAPVSIPAVTQGSVAPAAAPRASDRNRLISRDEVRRSGVTNAFLLVQSLRPSWLRGRGSDALRLERAVTRNGSGYVITDESPIVVYVDNRRMGTLKELESITAHDVGHVEYYDVVEAQQRWGPGHPQGAIHVITRR